MSGFFDDSHVTDVGLQGSMGRSVGFLDMVKQGVRQQYRVDSQMALDSELDTRWKESLRSLETESGVKFSLPIHPMAYRAYAHQLEGQPFDLAPLPGGRGDPYGEHLGYQAEPETPPEDYLKDLVQANEAIKKLNNPRIKSFEAILQEVAEMQKGVEEETSSMYERTGALGSLGGLLGAMGGSFTVRDPLNLMTAPIGAGRTIATRIAVDIGIAGATVAATEYGDVAPNRALVGLPERDSLFNVAAAALGAGALRGVFEGAGAGLRAVRNRASPDIDFDLRDAQLQQMFEANAASPRARAGASILSDATFIERNNPYGEGHLANVRFIAELQSVQRAMNAEPMTAIARVMPQVPYEYVQKVADFDIVKERAPQVYAKMEAAQAKLQEAKARVSAPKVIGREDLITPDGTDVKVAGDLLRSRADEALQRGDKVTLYADGKPVEITQSGLRDASGQKWGAMPILTDANGGNRLEITPTKAPVTTAERKALNKEYQVSYRAVEAEAARLNSERAAVEATQQAESSAILASQGLPFTGPLLRYDNVAVLVERINSFNDGLDEATAARFVRETLGEGDNQIELEVWEKDGGIDIGLQNPVDPDFRFITDEGEMTIAQAMRDLQDDTDLVEAIKVCAI